jgi:hypothetical protein
MKMLNRLAVLLFLLSSWACSSVRVVKTEPGDNFALSNYKTFGFYPIEATGDIPENTLYRSQLDALKETAARQLEARGLKRTDTNPELMVNIGVTVAEKVQTRQTNLLTDPPNYIGQRRYTWRSQEVETGRYRQGTVDVHLVDRPRNEMVWRGIVEGIVPNKSASLEKRIDESMDKLFSKL